MIVLSAGCASLAALMRSPDQRAGSETERASAEIDRRPRLIAVDGGDQRAVWISPARQMR